MLEYLAHALIGRVEFFLPVGSLPRAEWNHLKDREQIGSVQRPYVVCKSPEVLHLSSPMIRGVFHQDQSALSEAFSMSWANLSQSSCYSPEHPPMHHTPKTFGEGAWSMGVNDCKQDIYNLDRFTYIYIYICIYTLYCIILYICTYFIVL